MKNPLSFLLLMVFATTSTLAGPTTAILTQTVFIGYNDDYFCSLATKREMPPSHDRYVDYVYLLKRKNDGSLVEKTLLRQLYHKDKNYDGVWEHEDMVQSSVNIQQYLNKNKMFIPFQKPCADVLYLSFEEEGLFVKKGDQKKLLVNSAAMGKYIENYPFWRDKIVISKCYETAPPYCYNKEKCAGRDYFLVENAPFTEPPLYQSIIAIEANKLAETLDSLE